MPVFVDALLGDTMHLTADEFGAYCLILFATWRHGGQALPDDDRILSRICRVSPTRWRRTLRPRLIAFFDISDGHFHQKRLEKEWKYLSNLREKNRAGGKASALKRKELQATTVPAQLQPNGNPYTHTYISKEADAPLDISAPARANPREERSYGPGSRKTGIPTDWSPDSRDCEYAEARGWDAGRIGEEADAFADRCRRDRAVYADWHAAWRTWCRNADAFAARRNGAARSRPGGSGPGGIIAALGSFRMPGEME